MRKILGNPALTTTLAIATAMVVLTGVRHMWSSEPRLAGTEVQTNVTADFWQVPEGFTDLGVGQKGVRLTTGEPKEATTSDKSDGQDEETVPRRHLPKATNFELHPVITI